MKFIKYNDYWWKLDENYPQKKIFNEYSGSTDLDKPWDEYEWVEANNFLELNWNNTKVLNNYSKTGWLDREGNFYPCNEFYHDEQAEYVHRKGQRQLELEGWIRITRRSIYAKDEENSNTITVKRYYAMFCGNENGILPTDKQIQKLESMRHVDLSYIKLTMDYSIETRGQEF